MAPGMASQNIKIHSQLAKGNAKNQQQGASATRPTGKQDGGIVLKAKGHNACTPQSRAAVKAKVEFHFWGRVASSSQTCKHARAKAKAEAQGRQGEVLVI